MQTRIPMRLGIWLLAVGLTGITSCEETTSPETTATGGCHVGRWHIVRQHVLDGQSYQETSTLELRSDGTFQFAQTYAPQYPSCANLTLQGRGTYSLSESGATVNVHQLADCGRQLRPYARTEITALVCDGDSLTLNVIGVSNRWGKP